MLKRWEMGNKDDDAIKNSCLADWHRWIAAALLIFCLGFGCGFGIGYHTGAGVYDDAERAGRVEQQLDDAEKSQREITEGTERAAQRASDVEKRVERGQEAVDRADERAAAAQESESIAASTIDKCERILETIRERGTAN